MLWSHMDHTAPISPSLEIGVEYVLQTPGVSSQATGEHPRFGTYNYLLKLGEKFYLEVIAINSNAPQPNRPRWFELDEIDPSQPIRLATWIARYMRRQLLHRYQHPCHPLRRAGKVQSEIVKFG